MPEKNQPEMQQDNGNISVEREVEREPLERIAKTAEVLSQLIAASDGYIQTHDRAGGNPDLKQIDLRTPTEAGNGEYYLLHLGFQESTPGKNLMITTESPAGLDPMLYTNGIEAGVQPIGRRIQDFLYGADSQASVPVREQVFSYVYDYRAVGEPTNYNASKPQIDQLLGLLAAARVVRGGGQEPLAEGPQVKELVPDIAKILDT